VGRKGAGRSLQELVELGLIDAGELQKFAEAAFNELRSLVPDAIGTLKDQLGAVVTVQTRWGDEYERPDNSARRMAATEILRLIPEIGGAAKQRSEEETGMQEVRIYFEGREIPLQLPRNVTP
jgi:hypothetical protein